MRGNCLKQYMVAHLLGNSPEVLYVDGRMGRVKKGGCLVQGIPLFLESGIWDGGSGIRDLENEEFTRPRSLPPGY